VTTTPFTTTGRFESRIRLRLETVEWNTEARLEDPRKPRARIPRDGSACAHRGRRSCGLPGATKTAGGTRVGGRRLVKPRGEARIAKSPYVEVREGSSGRIETPSLAAGRRSRARITGPAACRRTIVPSTRAASPRTQTACASRSADRLIACDTSRRLRETLRPVARCDLRAGSIGLPLDVHARCRHTTSCRVNSRCERR